MDDLERYYNDFRKQALKNRIDYGKADLKSTVSWVLYEHPELKTRVKEIIPILNNIINSVNNMDLGEAEKELAQYNYQEYVRDEKRYLLPNDPSYIVLRFAPEPSGYMHIGHCKSVFLNTFYLEKYSGKLILRFDDTNPEKVSEEFERAMIEDLEWLKIKFSDVTHSSDYMDVLYKYAEKLIAADKMYLTLASQEEISKMRKEGIPVSERNNSVEENLEMFRAAVNGDYDEGEIVALYKGDLTSSNTVMRDPTMFRVVNHPHYRHKTKYKFWPTYDFATPILDSIQMVSHALRSKEYELRTELYHSILRDLGLRDIILIHFSRLEIRGSVTSKRKIRELVERGIVDGWDDPRLTTVRALRRRGILPAAIKEFISRFGPGKQETEVGWDMLLNINREIMDRKMKDIPKIPFIKNPKMISTRIVVEREGERFLWEGTLYIDEKEYSDILNLRGLGVVKNINGVFVSYPSDNQLPVTDWVEKPQTIRVKIPRELFLGEEELNPNSMEIIEGVISDKYYNNDRLYLNRLGYVIKDRENEYIFTC
ncbi:MAG: glutamate--tRNA ligase family protein [Candidatus Anstonellales archaeon]